MGFCFKGGAAFQDGLSGFLSIGLGFKREFSSSPKDLTL